MSRRLFVLLPLFLILAVNQKSAAQTCSPGNADPSLTICMPHAGDDLNSPIHLQIATNDSAKVDILQVWYNGVKRWENPVNSADFFLAAESAGRPGCQHISIRRNQDDPDNVIGVTQRATRQHYDDYLVLQREIRVV